MLKILRVRHLATIEDLQVEFGPGFNVLTGETGAGKSILVDALGLVAGDRADSGLVRDGEDRGVVEAVFEPEERGAWAAALEARGLEPDDAGLVIRREIAAEGSGRVFVNGSPTTVGVLRELIDDWVEIHGQHAHQGLLSPERHTELLDAYGRHADVLGEVERTWENVRQQRSRLAELEKASEVKESRLAELRRIVSEIDAVGPREGEGEALDRERRILQNSSQMANLLHECLEVLYEGEPSAAALTAAAARRARSLSEIDEELAEIASRIDATRLEIEDVATGLLRYRDTIDFDPGRLEDLESRKASLEKLRLRFGSTEAEVLDSRRRAAEEVATLERLEDEAGSVKARLREALDAYRGASARLTRARRSAAGRFGPVVEKQLAALSLSSARFRVSFREPRVAERCGDLLVHRRGVERAEFGLAANPGEPPKALSKVASGGELSRTMLALHVVLDGAGRGRTLVFDEVDAGVGGAVASAVGARLASLSRSHQVLCVTHLPQVAAHAGRHYHVRKHLVSGRARTDVHPLDREARVEELARMLGGATITAASRRNAEALIAEAVAARRAERSRS
jgi:DNA repair protein RecN (Recombination protein N)